MPPEGLYSYFYRFKPQGGDIWTYCDTDGTDNTDPEAGNLFDPELAGLMESTEGIALEIRALAAVPSPVAYGADSTLHFTVLGATSTEIRVAGVPAPPRPGP